MVITLIMLIGFLEGTVDGLRARGTSFRRLLLGLFPQIKKNHVFMQSTEALRLLCKSVQYIFARPNL